MTCCGRLPFRRLVWLMPAAFAVHIVEEFYGGFPAWVGVVTGSRMPVPDFLLNNAVFMMTRSISPAPMQTAAASGHLPSIWARLLGVTA